MIGNASQGIPYEGAAEMMQNGNGIRIRRCPSCTYSRRFTFTLFFYSRGETKLVDKYLFILLLFWKVVNNSLGLNF